MSSSAISHLGLQLSRDMTYTWRHCIIRGCNMRLY